MKTLIEPSEIRKGDLIRKEYGREIALGETALEYRATSDAHGKGGPGQHYLLDRPKPPVSLPSEPTLGWLTTYEGEESSGLGRHATKLGVFFSSDGRGITDEAAAEWWPTKAIISFTYATAVPTSALDELRREHDASLYDRQHVTDFLAAIDEASA